MMFLKKDLSMIDYIKRAIHNHGFISLYDGLSAQLLRQMTYMTLRFHLYDVGKRYVDESNFLHKVFVASISGLVASSVGIPCEMVNTRMHVDRMLKVKYRRNYRNVFDGLRRIWQDEGLRGLYKGGVLSCVRASLLTIGQNAMYDQVKIIYMRYFKWDSNYKGLHLTSSLTAALICAPLVQPIEILKTMEMTRGTTYLSSTSKKFKYMLRFGIRGLFRGMSPSLILRIPHTISMFFVYEQLRLNFGYSEENKL